MAESKLTLDDLNSLPSLVLELNRESRIASVHGAPALQNTLGKSLIDSKPADTVFLDDWASLTQLQREMILDLGKSIGDPVLVGELLAAQLPATAIRKSGGDGKVVRFQLSYGFPEESGAIKAILLQLTPFPATALGDSTNRTHSAIAVHSERERRDAELLLELHRCDRTVLAIVEKEVSSNLQSLASMISAGNGTSLDEYRKLFHSMKGATRQLGLLHFSKVALEAEHGMKDAIQSGKLAGGLAPLQEWKALLENEWKRILLFKGCTD